jgi:hypothetical protein
MRWFAPVLALAFTAFGHVSAHPLEQRGGIEYKIYAYGGDNIGGLQVYYSDGEKYFIVYFGYSRHSTKSVYLS